jgi:hypothetical protein
MTSVQLFGPGYGPNKWMKMDKAEAIMARNAQIVSMDPTAVGFDLQALLLQNYSMFATSDSADDEMRERCNFQ